MQSNRKRSKTAGLRYEREHWLRGHCYTVGIDEAGRGAWAGPVVAAAVSLPYPDGDLQERLNGVRDSKQMSARQRESLVDTIKATAVAWGIGSASSDEIDQIGIVPATRLAMRRALDELVYRSPGFQPDCLLLDSIRWDDAPVDCCQEHIVRGDSESLSIAAASVLAKVWRDDFMRDLDEEFPAYGFAAHKGYGTVQHKNALQQVGATPLHRKYFAPVKAVIEKAGES
jgi:ribonuclease HII